MTTLRDMKLFVQAVQSGSFSAAGRHLGLSPASVSRRINALEDMLDVRLLNRTSRQLSLTESGELYFKRAEQILNDVRETEEAVSQLQQVPRGILRVHSRMLVGTQYISPAIPRFLELYPEIKVDLTLSNFHADLVEQNLDVDIRIGSLADSSLIARKLMSSKRLVCATPDYLARTPKISIPKDLEGHNCLTYRINLGTPTWRFLAKDNGLTEVAVSGNLQSDNGQTLLMAMLAGTGIGMMPGWSVAEHIESGKLMQVLPDLVVSHIEFENGVYAVYQQNRHMSVKVRAFIDFLVEVFKKRHGPIA